MRDGGSAMASRGGRPGVELSGGGDEESPRTRQEVLLDRAQVAATPGTPRLRQPGPPSSPHPPPAVSPPSDSGPPQLCLTSTPPSRAPHCSVQVGPNFPERARVQGCRGPCQGRRSRVHRVLRGAGGLQAVGSEPQRRPCRPRPPSPWLAEPWTGTCPESLGHPAALWVASEATAVNLAPCENGDNGASLRGLSQLCAVVIRYRFSNLRN